MSTKFTLRIVIILLFLPVGYSLLADLFAAWEMNRFALSLLHAPGFDSMPERILSCPDKSQARNIRFPNTDDSDIHVLIGTAYWIEGQCEQAAQIWQQVVAEDGENLYARYWLGFYDYLAGQYEDLRTLWSGNGMFEASINNYASLSASTREEIFWLQLNFVAFPSLLTARRLEKTYQIDEQTEELVSMWDYLASTASQVTETYWWAQGKLAELHGDWKMARESYTAGLSLAAGEEEPFVFQIARMCALQQDYSCALDHYARYISHVPHSVSAMTGAGESAEALGTYDIALLYYRKALEYDSLDSRALQGVQRICTLTELCEDPSQ